MISGLQHFRFCRRQWALIHIEQQWAENLRTTEGALLHERAHDEQLRERRGDTIITRSLRVYSLNFAGYNPVCANNRSGIQGATASPADFAGLYPRAWCNLQTGQMNPSTLGNFRMKKSPGKKAGSTMKSAVKMRNGRRRDKNRFLR